MTTCNDSFCYGLVNPQIQLCPIRPSAAHLFFSVFPLALLSVVHLGSCGPTRVGCVPGTHPWPWERGRGRNECTERGDFAMDPQCCLACVQIQLNALSSEHSHFQGWGNATLFPAE